MKKVISKVFLIGLVLMSLLQNFCFAIETNPMSKPIADSVFQNNRKMMKDANPKTHEISETFNFLPIIITIVIVITIVITVIVIIKNKKKKEVDRTN